MEAALEEGDPVRKCSVEDLVFVVIANTLTLSVTRFIITKLNNNWQKPHLFVRHKRAKRAKMRILKKMTETGLDRHPSLQNFSWSLSGHIGTLRNAGTRY